MNKLELLTALSGKFYKVGEATLRQTDEFGINYYLVKVYDKVGDAIRDSNLAFYVENEGEANEIAYWSPSEPKPEAVENFDAKLQAYLDSKITDGTVEGAFIEESNAILENAVVRVIMDESGTLVEKRLFLDRDANGDVRHGIIG